MISIITRPRLRQSLYINGAGSVVAFFILGWATPWWYALILSVNLLFHGILIVESYASKGLSARGCKTRWEWANIPQLVILWIACMLGMPQKMFYICSIFAIIGIIYNSTTVKSRFYSGQLAVFILGSLILSAILLEGEHRNLEIAVYVLFSVSSIIVMRETVRVVRDGERSEQAVGDLRVQVEVIKIANQLTLHDLRNQLARVQYAATLLRKAPPAAAEAAGLLDHTVEASVQAMHLLDVERRSPFDLRKAVVHVCEHAMKGRVEVDPSVRGCLDFYFLLFTSNLKNLFDNACEAHARRPGEGAALRLRIWRESGRLVIEDNAGGLPFPVDEIGKRSSKGSGERRTFLGILQEGAPELGYAVRYENTGAGFRVTMDFGARLA